MSLDRDTKYLNDILKECENIETFTKGIKDWVQLRDDKKTGYAVVRSITIIGEAAKKLSQTKRDSNPEVPWSLIMGMRDRLVHDYGGVDYEIVWNVIKEEIPNLVHILKK